MSVKWFFSFFFFRIGRKTFRTLFFSLYIFRFGYVHCDPHPGNVLVQKDPQGHVKIVLLDHGLYTVKEYEKQKK